MFALRSTERPLGRRSWYQRLARRVAAGPPSASVLFEWTRDRPIPWAVVRPESLAREWSGPDGSGTPRVERGPLAPAPEAPEGWATRYGILWPQPPGTTPDPVRDGGPDGPPDDPSTWFAGQTLWMPDGRGGLRMTFRFAVAAATGPAAQSGFDRVGTQLASAW